MREIRKIRTIVCPQDILPDFIITISTFREDKILTINFSISYNGLPHMIPHTVNGYNIGKPTLATCS